MQQTQSYLLTVLMDYADTKQRDLDLWIHNYYGSSLEKVIPFVAASGNPDKYPHHILLRYLFSRYGTEELRTKYLSHKKAWQSGLGHPWELIEFYRAMLLPEGEERQMQLQKAYKLACKGGPTLRLIAAVILGAIRCMDKSVTAELGKVVEQVEKDLPRLGEARLAALRAQAETPQDPLTLAQAVLPFNFR